MKRTLLWCCGVFQFSPVGNVGTFVNFGLVRNEKVKVSGSGIRSKTLLPPARIKELKNDNKSNSQELRMGSCSNQAPGAALGSRVIVINKKLEAKTCAMRRQWLR